MSTKRAVPRDRSGLRTQDCRREIVTGTWPPRVPIASGFSYVIGQQRVMMAASLEIFQFVGWIRKSAQNILMMPWWRLSCMKHNGNILNSRRMCRFHLRTCNVPYIILNISEHGMERAIQNNTVRMVPPTRTFLTPTIRFISCSPASGARTDCDRDRFRRRQNTLHIKIHRDTSRMIPRASHYFASQTASRNRARVTAPTPIH